MYNLTVLTTVDGCDRLLEEAQHEKDNLVYRRNKVISAQTNQQSYITDTQNELADVTASITTITAEIDAMADGTIKNKKISERYRLLSKQLNLQDELNSSSGVLNVNRQHDIKRIDASMVEIDAFIAALEARKLELQNG